MKGTYMRKIIEKSRGGEREREREREGGGGGGEDERLLGRNECIGLDQDSSGCPVKNRNVSPANF